MKKTVDQKLTQLAQRNKGAVLRKDAYDDGISKTSLQRRQKSGLLIPVTSTSYIYRDLREDLSVLSALSLSYPEGGVARRTTAALAGLPVDPFPLRFVVSHGERPDPRVFPVLDSIVVHETRHLADADRTEIAGLKSCTVARALCDMFPFESAGFIVHLVELALTQRIMTQEELLGCLAERMRRGAKGTIDFSRLLAGTLTDHAYPESLFELELLRALEGEGVSGLEPQFRPPWYDGIRGVADIGDPIGDPIIEADGREFRQVTAAHDNDRRRDRLAASYGFLTIRVGHREFFRAKAAVASEIAALITERRRLRASLDVAA